MNYALLEHSQMLAHLLKRVYAFLQAGFFVVGYFAKTFHHQFLIAKSSEKDFENGVGGCAH